MGPWARCRCRGMPSRSSGALLPIFQFQCSVMGFGCKVLRVQKLGFTVYGLRFTVFRAQEIEVGFRVS